MTIRRFVKEMSVSSALSTKYWWEGKKTLKPRFQTTFTEKSLKDHEINSLIISIDKLSKLYNMRKSY